MKHKSKMCRIQIYNEAFKRKVIEEYLTTGISKVDLLKKYNIRTRSGIQRWIKDLGMSILIDRFNRIRLIKIWRTLIFGININ